MPQPLVKWAGGKRQLLPLLVDRVGTVEGTYFEPFVGGGALFLALAPNKAVIGDANQNVVELYRMARDLPHTLVAELECMQEEYNALPTAERKRDYYNAVRDQYNEEPTGLAQAARMIFLNKCGFNGLYRENAHGAFNVPWGKKERLNLYDLENVMEVAELLKRTTVFSGDFVKTCSRAKEGDTVFLDPPYDGTFTGYRGAGFTDEDQQRVADLFMDLTMRGCRVIATNADTPMIRAMYDGAEITPVAVKRMINRNANDRKGTELLIDNRRMG